MNECEKESGVEKTNENNLIEKGSEERKKK